MELNLLNLSLDLPDMSGVLRKSLESELELYSSIIWVYMNQEKIQALSLSLCAYSCYVKVGRRVPVYYIWSLQRIESYEVYS